MPRPTRTRWGRRAPVPLALVLVALSLSEVRAGQTDRAPATVVARTLAETGDTAAGWGRRIEQMQRAGSLRLRSSREDAMVEGRVHDRFDQYAGDVPIFGAQVVRQRSTNGVETVFGELYPDDLGISLTPRLGAEQAAARISAIAGRAPIGGQVPELVVLPREDGSFTLAWQSHVRIGGDFLAIFVDAQTGDEVWRYSVRHTQASVGTGTGVLGERKKLATQQQGGAFFATDTLRPPSLVTLDMKGNHDRVFSILDGDFGPAASDVATDTDNTWTDGAVVDGHSGIGFTYDYYFARFNRRGVDNNNRNLRTIIHPANRNDPLSLPDEVIGSLLLNAFWCPVCGQAGNTGFLVFGEGVPTRFVLDGQNWNYFASAFDVVAHEYTHAVTSFSSDLIDRNESGALNESFSDVMAVGAEFYLAASGRSTRPPDYILGEDAFTPVAPGALSGTRTLSDPLAYGYPDHYSIRFRGPEDGGGVHINSSISNHAFFLAIEGGTNRTSRLAVEGVGAANREQIERVFYRGFTAFLTPNATFAQARQATLRAASELYGDSSAAFRAVQQAWTAVGVN
jgi:Zn-dependent metalloprotease